MKKERSNQPLDLDSTAIADALRRVQNGELSPAEATTLLLAQQPALPARETLQDLIGRLGTPPADIVDGWCQQMRATAEVHHKNTNEPLPQIDLQEWSLSPKGELELNGRNYLADWNASESTTVDSVSEKRIQDFRRELLGAGTTSRVDRDHTTGKSVAPLTQASPSNTLVNDRPASNSQQDESTEPKVTASSWPRVAMASLAVIGLATIVGILIMSSGSKSPKANNVSKKMPAKSNRALPVKTGISSKGTSDQLSTDPVGSEEPMVLETIEDDTSTIDESVEIGNANQIEMDSIIKPDLPVSAKTDPAATETMPKSVDAPSEQIANAEPDGEMPTMPELAPLGDDDGDARAPEESPQTVRSSEVTSVRLPRVDLSEESVQLWNRPVDSLVLEFPYDVPLKLSDDAERIIDTAKEQTVAIVSKTDTATNLSWASDANRLATANLLWHGRLKNTADKDLVYLRPSIQADPLPLVLDRADIRPTWDLSGPVPSKVTRVSVNFQLPKELEFGWIEPIDPEKPRRAKGLAVLKLTDSEDVSLGLRFDIRCSRKLSCRVRFAAKLDSEAPWTIVSRPMLEQFASQLTTQLEFASKQSTQMAKYYSDAGTEKRRILRPKRDALKQQLEMLRTYLERVVQLQGLISRVESSAKLNLKLWIQWDDGEQVLLETKSPEPAE